MKTYEAEAEEQQSREFNNTIYIENDSIVTKIERFKRRTSLNGFRWFISVLKKGDVKRYYRDIVSYKPSTKEFWQVSIYRTTGTLKTVKEVA